MLRLVGHHTARPVTVSDCTELGGFQVAQAISLSLSLSPSSEPSDVNNCQQTVRVTAIHPPGLIYHPIPKLNEETPDTLDIPPPSPHQSKAHKWIKPLCPALTVRPSLGQTFRDQHQRSKWSLEAVLQTVRSGAVYIVGQHLHLTIKFGNNYSHSLTILRVYYRIHYTLYSQLRLETGGSSHRTSFIWEWRGSGGRSGHCPCM